MANTSRSRPARYRTADPLLDARLESLVVDAGATADQDQLFEILVSAVRLAGDHAARLDLKIVNAALKEMREAFLAFAPYRTVPKVTMFGSARTARSDPNYTQARDLAIRMAAAGWMVVTGAGPGIMAAGLEGAGRERSFGVSIRLPIEEAANEYIVGDEKLINMKYFFTRKLMLMKESRGFVSLPGGFGTQDETFELLTLQQTGKSDPAPIVLLDAPGGTYWTRWVEFFNADLVERGLVNADDVELFTVTDDVAAAADELIGFYRNYHSIRWVGTRLVVRLEAAPTPAEIIELNDRFGDICRQGHIAATEPLPPEVTDDDRLDKARLVLEFDFFRHGRLRAFIDAVNALPSAPAEPTPPPP
jgi:uncharacterized protein (TIGR00730 family)